MMRYVKIGFVLILVVMLYLLGRKDAVGDVSIESLESKIVSGSGISMKMMKKGDEKDFRRFYNIEPGKVQYFLYVPSTVMSVDEILVIKAKNYEQAEQYCEAIIQRLDSQKKSFEQYGTNQMNLLNQSTIEVKGKYLLFVVSDQSVKVKEQFENAIVK